MYNRKKRQESEIVLNLIELGGGERVGRVMHGSHVVRYARSVAIQGGVIIGWRTIQPVREDS